MAYGTNKPFGLRPVSPITGGSWTEKLGKYTIYSNRETGGTLGTPTERRAIFQGDPVTLAIEGTVRTENNVTTVSDTSVFPVIQRFVDPRPDADAEVGSASVKPLLGVFHSCEYTLPNGRFITDNKWPGGGLAVMPGTQIIAYVHDDPMTIFEIQVSSSNNRIADAIFAGNYTATANRKPNTLAYFGQNFYFNLGGTDWDTSADNALYPNTLNNPSDGDMQSGISGVYLDVGQGNRGSGRAFDFTLTDNPIDDTAGATAPTNAAQINNLADTLNNVIRDLREDFLDEIIPLKVLSFSDHPENTVLDENGFVRPFLNVRVVINNHVAQGSTYGIGS